MADNNEQDQSSDTVSLADNPKFMAIIEQARAQRRSGLGMSTEEVREALGIPQE